MTPPGLNFGTFLVPKLAREIDRYKFRHRRRFINYEEILALVKELGYQKDSA